MPVKTTKTIPNKYILMTVMRKPKHCTTEPRKKMKRKTYLRIMTSAKILKIKKIILN